MPPAFASTKMSALGLQLGAMRVAQPSFTQIAVSKVEPAAASTVVAQPVKAKEADVPTGSPVLTTPIQNIRFIDPVFAQNIINLRPLTEGLPRGQINVPVSPSENVTDELIFEGASDPALKFYIPRYRLAQQLRRRTTLPGCSSAKRRRMDSHSALTKIPGSGNCHGCS